MVGTVTSQEERLHPSSTMGPFSFEFACSPCVYMGTQPVPTVCMSLDCEVVILNCPWV